ncbi:MAG: flagellar export chaperone FliS [Burkholderiales bacterium]|nr:flagellar export chaperone FliS [Burkholderiales bacterium]
MTNLTNRALSAYSNVDLVSAVNSASPMQLILLLYDGAISSLATAKGQMQDMKFAEKGRLISKAIGIIEGLRSVLDFDKGGDISNNLNDLYEYMKHRLTIANLKNDPEGPAEVIRLLNDLRTAWAKLDERERANAVAEMAKGNQKQPALETGSLRA